MPYLCLCIVMASDRMANTSVELTMCPSSVPSPLATSVNPHKAQSTHLPSGGVMEDIPAYSGCQARPLNHHSANTTTKPMPVAFPELAWPPPKSEWESNFWQKQKEVLKWHSHLLLPSRQLFLSNQSTSALSSEPLYPFHPCWTSLLEKLFSQVLVLGMGLSPGLVTIKVFSPLLHLASRSTHPLPPY